MSTALKSLLKDRKSNTVQDEIRRKVLARYSNLQEQESEKFELEATLDALQEMTGLPKYEIDKIAKEVQESNREIELSSSTPEIGTGNTSVDEEVIFKELTSKSQAAKKGFIYHLVPYGMINAALIVLNLVTTSFPWALFPLFFWGIGVLSHYLAAVYWPRKELIRIITTVKSQLHHILSENCLTYNQGNRSDILKGLYRLTMMRATQANMEEYLKHADPTLSESDTKQISTQVMALQQQYSPR